MNSCRTPVTASEVQVVVGSSREVGWPVVEEFDDVSEGGLVADVAGEHDVGVSTTGGRASTGWNTETRPGRSWPRTVARRMPRPRTAMSWEVMPPLATTQAGPAATAPRTTSTTAVDTCREISRLAAGSVSRTRVRLVNKSTSEPASAPTTRAVTSAT
jgi:hypothetical protein